MHTCVFVHACVFIFYVYKACFLNMQGKVLPESPDKYSYSFENVLLYINDTAFILTFVSVGMNGCTSSWGVLRTYVNIAFRNVEGQWFVPCYKLFIVWLVFDIQSFCKDLYMVGGSLKWNESTLFAWCRLIPYCGICFIVCVVKCNQHDSVCSKVCWKNVDRE